MHAPRPTENAQRSEIAALKFLLRAPEAGRLFPFVAGQVVVIFLIQATRLALTTRTRYRSDNQQSRGYYAYSISSSSPPPPPPPLEAIDFRLLRPGRPPPYGEVTAKSMCFCESVRTMKDGMLTICLPTRM